MKRLMMLATALLLAACSAAPAIAGPNSLIITQRNDADTGNILRTLENPATDGILVWRKSTQRPAYITLGTGFSVSGGMLTVSGAAGPQGPAGAPGAAGTDGKSAYQLAVDTGYSSTVAAWLASLKGADGTAGATGAAGKDGLSITGPAGPTGSAGRDGAKGDKGDTGSTGATGATGAQGPAGTPAPTFNFGLPVARTLAVSTAYQALIPAKPGIVTVSPVCTASLSLSGGGTCTLQARIGTAGLTCSTGTVVGTWTNVNTGALTVGLALNQIIGSPYGINLPTGAYFVLCPTAGTFTITAVEQTGG
jgi:hypothetical protein